jgi:dTDP-4-amino-4,6-dideoxygalactose transaminase
MYLRRHPVAHLAPGATSAQEQRGQKPARYEQRFSNAQAAIALRQLRRLGDNLTHRRQIAALYHEQLTQAGFKVPLIPPASQPAFVRFPVMVEDRDLAMRVASQRVVLGQWFNSVLEESHQPSDGDYLAGSCPRAEYAAAHLVNLPTHLRVKAGDVEVIKSIFASFEPAKGL